ncbi:hypothetical protein [Paenibacillus sp. FSL H7-0326]|uniref:hypothetical protein n=1 Tax=Paenibacillus sp. FSL H7-0326 TaxID=1921144 RepID=UPI0011808937|nr:hypothetical protein [Paenibacillus sp. FSL H7-0326]
MHIQNFDKFRIENERFADVQKIGSHSSDGFMVTAYCMKSWDKYSQHKVEVRKKEREVALITYRRSDAEIPEYWRDAEVLFSWTEEKK